MRTPTSAVLCSVLLFTSLVRAQGGDKASAEILFNEGRALAQQGNYQVACEKLAESQRMDPAVGTLLNLGDCQEKLGRTASAWATWLEAAAAAKTAGQADREAHARQRAEALAPRLVTLTIDVPAAHRVPGLTIVRNTVSLGPALWGTATPVDPGNYEISATAPGYLKWTSAVSVNERTPARVVVPPLSPEPVLPAASPAPPSAGPTSTEGAVPVPPEQSRSERSGGSSIPVLAYVLGGVGVAGIGVGTVFGLVAMNKNEKSKDECETDTLCSSAGVELRDDAFSAATVSTVGFALGGVGLASAAVLLITAPSREESATRPGLRGVHAGVDSRGAAITVDGVF